MKLKQTAQIEFQDLRPLRFDLSIAASGYEARSAHIATRSRQFSVDRRVAVGFADRIELSRQDNDAVFDRFGYAKMTSAGNSAIEIEQLVRDFLEGNPNRDLSILIDYSTMTRTWYAGILRALQRASHVDRSVTCYFCYSFAAFVQPAPAAPNSEVFPIEGFCNLATPDEPTALVIGLGYERERALGLAEYVDAAKTYAVYTDPALDDRYMETVLRNNGEFLRSLPQSCIFRHPVDDLQRTGNLLSSLCLGLSEEFRVILAPLGIKPFSLLCLLLAIRFPRFDVWRVTAGSRSEPQNREAAGPIAVLKAVFAQ